MSLAKQPTPVVSGLHTQPAGRVAWPSVRWWVHLSVRPSVRESAWPSVRWSAWQSACRLLLGWCLVATLTQSAWAIKDPAGATQEREEIRQAIKALTQDIESTASEQEKTRKLLQLLDKRVEQSRSRIERLDKDRKQIETEIAGLNKQESALLQELEETEKRLGEVLRNQYRRQDYNPTQAWLAGRNASEAAREGYWFERISRAERELAETQQAKALKLEAVRTDLEVKQTKLAELITRQNLRTRELNEQRDERKALLADLNDKLEDQQLKKKRLERDEQRLTKLISELNTALEAARREQARKKAEASRSKPPAGTDKPVARDAFPAEPFKGDFAGLKGRLPLPVEGTVTGRFGQTREKDGSGSSWKGIFIEAIDGKPVQAVGAGRVVFAEWLRGFGEIVIVDHGDQFLSVYGNNERLLKSAGDTVKQGEKIAEVGSSSGNLSTGLYFELRHQGKPFDPLSWTPGGK